MSDTVRGLEIPEPPKKRPRVSGTIDDIGLQSTGPDSNSVRIDVHDELDEAKLEETQEPKASDLYLDTVSSCRKFHTRQASSSGSLVFPQ
jgi:hypothetical protein